MCLGGNLETVVNEINGIYRVGIIYLEDNLKRNKNGQAEEYNG